MSPRRARSTASTGSDHRRPGDQETTGGTLSPQTAVRASASVLLAAFWVVDRCRLQHRPDQSTPDQDRRSALVWDAANLLQVTGIAVAFSPIGRIDGSTRIQCTGLVTMILGILFRWHAMRTLGSLFTGKVSIQSGHRLIRVGPYAYLRHPAYTGSLVAHAGLGLALANWWSLAVSTLPYVVAVVYRTVLKKALWPKRLAPNMRSTPGPVASCRGSIDFS